MRGVAYQPTDCTGGGKLINQEVAWVSIGFDVAYCEPGSARILVKLDGTTVLNEVITPGMSPIFERFTSQRYVSNINFALSVTDWTVAINNVILGWADEAQAPAPQPNGNGDYTLRFPITLQDEVTLATRLAKANEIEFGIDGDGYALTEYPRDKGEEGGSAIWFANNSVYVAKLYPYWCPYTPIVSPCRPTEPVEYGKNYRGDVKWKANPAYITDFSFYLAEGDTTKVVPLTLVVPTWAPPPNGNGNGNGDGNGWNLDRIGEWIKENPILAGAIGLGTYLLVSGGKR